MVTPAGRSAIGAVDAVVPHLGYVYFDTMLLLMPSDAFVCDHAEANRLKLSFQPQYLRT